MNECSKMFYFQNTYKISRKKRTFFLNLRKILERYFIQICAYTWLRTFSIDKTFLDPLGTWVWIILGFFLMKEWYAVIFFQV